MSDCYVMTKWNDSLQIVGNPSKDVHLGYIIFQDVRHNTFKIWRLILSDTATYNCLKLVINDLKNEFKEFMQNCHHP